ncbi:hypothetical protein GCM10009117_00480 [Gangjinia marincola]|uniref:Uncharacterized protein n=1 Tax=Gangjinia marincola TaxID=578463 RepID=A0ABP3XR87_9FLAO
MVLNDDRGESWLFVQPITSVSIKAKEKKCFMRRDLNDFKPRIKKQT